MLSGETANTNIIFFHLTRAGIELTIYTALELEASKMEFEQTITFIWKRIKLNRGLCFLITFGYFLTFLIVITIHTPRSCLRPIITDFMLNSLFKLTNISIALYYCHFSIIIIIIIF